MFTSLQASLLTWSAVAAIGVLVVQLLSFLHTFLKDVGIQARRTRVLERTKLHLDVWDKWCDLQLKVLPEWEINASKAKASEAIEHIRHQTDLTLRALNPKANPITINGLPQWRHRCLLYFPKPGKKIAGSLARLVFLFFVSLIGLMIYFFVFAIYPYLQSLNGKHTMGKEHGTPPQLIVAFVLFVLFFLYIEFMCISIYMSIYKEGAEPIAREIDRL